jgi:predicted  nucleic acid-binding Zn-ribbon protein
METVLDLLIEIQLADDETKNIQSLIQSIPAKVERLEREIGQAAESLHDRQNRVQEIRKDYKMKEGDIAENDSKITKLNAQTFAVKTNEEYRAIINEIEFLKADNKKIEDTMINLLEEEETLKATIGKVEAETAGYISVREEKLRALNTEKEELSKKLDSARTHFDNTFARLPDEIKDLYTKIKKVRGNAVCLIENQTCTGCSSILTPQVLNELKKRNEIITCDNCGRILIYVEPENAH